jgi:hypothetical protein
VYILSFHTLYLKVLNGCFELFTPEKRVFAMILRDVYPVWWHRKELHGREMMRLAIKASRKVEIEVFI